MDGLAGGFTALCSVPAKAQQLASQHSLQRVLIRLREDDARIEAGNKVLEKRGGVRIHLLDSAQRGLGKNQGNENL